MPTAATELASDHAAGNAPIPDALDFTDDGSAFELASHAAAAQWIGLIGLIVFSGMLVWSLVIGHKTPPGKQ